MRHRFDSNPGAERLNTGSRWARSSYARRSAHRDLPGFLCHHGRDPLEVDSASDGTPQVRAAVKPPSWGGRSLKVGSEGWFAPAADHPPSLS